MQWYTRTPARNPTISAIVPVTTVVIPTTVPGLKDCTTSVSERNGTLIYNGFWSITIQDYA